MAERRLPSNLQHFNRLLTEYAKQDNGMPVSRARHAIGVIVICSMIDRVRDTFMETCRHVASDSVDRLPAFGFLRLHRA